MLRFDAGRAREWAGMMAIVQVMMGAGMAITYGFLYPVITPMVALYIVTGRRTLALIPLGLVMVPIGVSQQKVEGTFDFIWSLPAPRTAQAASTFLLWTALSIPGMVVAVAISAWRYGVTLTVTPAIVPAVLLSRADGDLGRVRDGARDPEPDHREPDHEHARVRGPAVLADRLPLSHLPTWLADVAQVLPFYAMAQIVRAALTTGIVDRPGRTGTAW